MIRLTHLAGSLTGSTSFESNEIIQIGRAQDCDLRYDVRRDIKVSGHHAHIVLQQGGYWLIDTGSTNGTTVNGERIVKQLLKSGDHVVFGTPGGPEVEVTIELAGGRRRETSEGIRTEFAMVDPGVAAAFEAREEAERVASMLKTRLRDSSAKELVDVAAQRVADERIKAGKPHSGHSMFILAGAFNAVSNTVKAKTRRKWVRVVLAVAGVAAIAVLVMGVVIYFQHRRIASMLSQKRAIDTEILAVEEQMQEETDPDRLAQLEEMLGILSGSAERTVARLSETDSSVAAAAVSSDTLEQDIRAILAKFDAATYAIPPIFKERLQFHITELVRAGNLNVIYARRQRYWPVITREFNALGLPEEMAYIAWAESQFDSDASSDAGARGMWQMTVSTAQALGLEVDAGVDERLNVARQTHAAARHLANLLSEFGEDSFMLAMASYNRGEAGVRRALHDVAQEQGGFRKDKRDFWHLYRLKKLPPETREYVPKVLAAAIVCTYPERYGLAN